MPKNGSGNDYNGLGRKDVYRALPQFHSPTPHPWFKVTALFFFRTMGGNFNTVISAVKHKWREVTGHVPVADEVVRKSPEEFTAEVKKIALAHPEVEVVGITRMKDEYRFEGHDSSQYKWVITVGRSMDYDSLARNLKGDFSSAITQVIGGYELTQRGAVHVANWIRSQGWPAKGYGGLSTTEGEWFLSMPPAIASGIGQLAKNGSMISDKLGSAFRIASVLTDMPLVEDKPREIGVDEFCMSCKKCTEDCPPGAISDKKQMVRGVEKWYVDFDKCMPFVTEHNACGICLSTCPWSRPGVAPSLSQKMLKKMARRQETELAS